MSKISSIHSFSSSHWSHSASRIATAVKKPSAQSWPTSRSSSCSSSPAAASGSSGNHSSGARCSGRVSASWRTRSAQPFQRPISRVCTWKASSSSAQAGALPPQTTGCHSLGITSEGDTTSADRNPSRASRLKPLNGTARWSSSSARRSIWSSSRWDGGGVRLGMGARGDGQACMVVPAGGLRRTLLPASGTGERCHGQAGLCADPRGGGLQSTQPPSTVSSIPVTNPAPGLTR